MTALIEQLAAWAGTLKAWEVVDEWQAGIMLRRGQFYRPISSGWHWIVPLIDRIEVVEITPRVVDIGAISVEAAKGRVIAASGNLEFRISCAKDAIMEVDDLDSSLIEMVRGVAADCVIEMDGEPVSTIADEVIERASTYAEAWGVSVSNFWFTDYAPHRVVRLLQDG